MWVNKYKYPLQRIANSRNNNDICLATKNTHMNLKSQFILSVLLLFSLSNSQAQLLLNEVKVNPPGNDNPFEFIELKGTPGSIITNTYLLILEGDSGSAGNADLVVRLNNITLGSNGLYFIGTSLGYTINSPTILRDTLIFGIPGGILENGSSTFMLVFSTTPIVYGLDYDTNNDGVPELPAGAVVLDSFGWITVGSTAAILYSPAVLTQSTGTPDAAVRFYGNTTANAASAWYCGDLIGTGASSTFDALEISFNFPVGGALSPGDHNLPNSLGLNKLTGTKILVSPNPAADKINFSGNTFGSNASFQIFDMTGRLQLDGLITPGIGEIDVDELPNGLYLLKILDQGEEFFTKFEVYQ
jgi:hypothetical protein